MNWRERARRLRDEVEALAVASRDPRTPWYAKGLILVTVGLAVSPIDPIPDFIPVLGYLDDLVLVPTGAYLARRAMPDAVLADARETAAEADGMSETIGWFVAVLVVLAWLALALSLWQVFA